MKPVSLIPKKIDFCRFMKWVSFLLKKNERAFFLALVIIYTLPDLLSIQIF